MVLKKRLFVFLALIVSLIVPFHAVQLHALSGSEFQAGRIIDDAVFFNKDTMNVAQIQQFLNSKVPVCDTNGTERVDGTTRAERGRARGDPPPFVCLKDYRQQTTARPAQPGLCNGYAPANQSAAEIIYGVAQSCGINPQALLVLIQKEQGLVADEWPLASLYRIAVGYACPDDAPCAQEFFGFFNQLYSAASQLKRYGANPGAFAYAAGRFNFIQYNPDVGCGGSRVYIQNRATAALYNYTPYQPNAAALNNLYGSGNGCSAYGNRNFWRYFNDWFGSPYAPTRVPTAAITVNGLRKNTVEYGSNVTIGRQTENVNSCSLDPGEGVNAEGRLLLSNVRSPIVFTLRCTGPYGNAGDRIRLEVQPPTIGYLRDHLARIAGEDAKNTVLRQLDQAETNLRNGNVGAAKYILTRTVPTVEEIVASERLPKQVVDDYAHAIRSLADSLGAAPVEVPVTVSEAGCYIPAPGTPGYTVEYEAFEDLRGLSGIAGGGAGLRVAPVPTAGQGAQTYGIIRDSNGNTVTNNSALITPNQCPPAPPS